MLFSKPIARKVPEITVFFWIIKLLTTAMGEATSDFLVARFNPYLAVGMGAIALGFAFFLQFSARRYNPWTYWLTASMVAVFGTMAADGMHVQLGVPYIVSTGVFGVTLLLVFIAWKKSEGTLSIHTIVTQKKEVFYWLVVLATFALGTAAGDLTATTFGLGYFSAGLMFIGLIVIPAIIFAITRKHEVLWFWTAYILTRPLGASFADWTSKPHSIGGLGFGDGSVALTLAVVIIALVTCLSITGWDSKRQQYTMHD